MIPWTMEKLHDLQSLRGMRYNNNSISLHELTNYLYNSSSVVDKKNIIIISNVTIKL